MPNQYDQYVSNMKIDRLYQSKDGGSWGVALQSSLAKLDPKVWTPIMDKLQEKLSKRLGIPDIDGDMHGVYYGLTPERNEVRFAPYSGKVTKEQLQTAMQAEINEAKARVAGKKVTLNVEGGVSTEEIAAQSAGVSKKVNQIG